MDWHSVAEELPEEGLVVMTKTVDENGEWNEKPLRRQGELWYFPDEPMYVYYEPTHWAYCDLTHRQVQAALEILKNVGKVLENIATKICEAIIKVANALGEFLRTLFARLARRYVPPHIYRLAMYAKKWRTRKKNRKRMYGIIYEALEGKT